MEKVPCVYILAKASHSTLYTGVTSDLPGRVHLLDLTELPQTFPFLHLQLAQARFPKVVMSGVPDERLATVFTREARNHAVTVLPDALHEITGDADVERPVPRARHDIDVPGFHQRSMAGLPLKLQSGPGPLPAQGSGKGGSIPQDDVRQPVAVVLRRILDLLRCR
jgi:hypothetical protein